MENDNDIVSNFFQKNIKLKLLIQGTIVGALSGLLIVFYRITLDKAELLRQNILNFNIEKVLLVLLWFIILISLSYIVGRLVKSDPLISGSGIPQVEGILLKKIKINWFPLIVRKFIGGVISIGAGLSLGREGPSIQLGAAVGQGVSRTTKNKAGEKYLITCGAAAGLAAAFNAPLAGIMFVLEEVHKHFSPLILLPTMSAALTADFISKQFFGLKPVFNFTGISLLGLENYLFIIGLGIIVGIFGAIYNFSLIKTQNIYKKQKWLPMKYKIMIPFLISGVLVFIMPEVLGGGHHLIESLIQGKYTVKVLFVILVVKFVFSMISYGSGAPGGIFFPLLVLGALTGSLYGIGLVNLFNLNPEYINNFMILAMAGLFSAIVRAPITGSILITEMTGSFSHFLSISIISLVAYITANLLKSAPIYESLLENLLKDNSNKENANDSKEKVLLEFSVYLDSAFDGKVIKDMKLPSNCLIVSIKRGEEEIIPKGNTIVNSGDYLYILVNENEAASIKERLSIMSCQSVIV
ncbi:ClC family H(+)/Cl(-) exchange transporter [Sedimentibacter sp. MB31-C6]|uniref:ClC family H(+)/Cl(-) exchange transporter n=1 Tax=Sedimentibacter sp. MB31-C6 TaxID=3109366 RepID=UPI002DDCD6E4|nr:ClC family H(+)/Cl(-) exchange transporter [Sedimentibacter sp. MB36-C1]WSI03242.1 ClC family H(+)/Cl(-) exchange transporter [Sedimentibacter sp. MB36-C1]